MIVLRHVLPTKYVKLSTRKEKKKEVRNNIGVSRYTTKDEEASRRAQGSGRTAGEDTKKIGCRRRATG